MCVTIDSNWVYKKKLYTQVYPMCDTFFELGIAMYSYCGFHWKWRNSSVTFYVHTSMFDIECAATQWEMALFFS